MRELEQCVRRIFLKGSYAGDDTAADLDLAQTLISGLDQGNIDSYQLTSGYCYLLTSGIRPLKRWPAAPVWTGEPLKNISRTEGDETD
ncbi:MAG: hypothetical protein R2860_10365 [Desulfobacterales bacterium]